MNKTPLERITAVMKYYYRRGANKESVNKIYKKNFKRKIQIIQIIIVYLLN